MARVSPWEECFIDRLLVVLDLDETLVFATPTPLRRDADFVTGGYYVYVRPGLSGFLAKLRLRVDIGVWTSASEDHAHAIVAQVFPHPEALRFLWSRDRCTWRYDHESREWYWVKDLKKLKRRGFALERVVLVDDTPRKLERNYGNLIPVPPFYGDPQDRVLSRLDRFLVTLIDIPDVRRIDKRRWDPGDPSTGVEGS